MADTDQDELLSYGDLLEMTDALAEKNQALREEVKVLKEFIDDCVTYRG